jgi:hypothetical protein
MQEVRRFQVRSETTGEEFALRELHDIREHRMQDGSISRTIRSKELRLSDGRSVSPTDDKLDIFQVLDTGEIFRKIG